MWGVPFLDGLREGLKQIGFTENEAKKYLFHGWRHFFTSYMVRKLDKKLLKGQTGHLTDIMIDRYSDHDIVGDREIIQATEREAFAGLLPEFPTEPQGVTNDSLCGSPLVKNKMLVFKREPEKIAVNQ